MRRREFISLIGSAATWWPLGAFAQEPGRIYRIGGLSTLPRTAGFNVALYEELRRAGFVEGQNLVVSPGSYGLSADRLAPFAAELAKAKVDVIFAGGDSAIRAAQQATSTI